MQHVLNLVEYWRNASSPRRQLCSDRHPGDQEYSSKQEVQKSKDKKIKIDK
jgi:hypothetical protein